MPHAHNFANNPSAMLCCESLGFNWAMLAACVLACSVVTDEVHAQTQAAPRFDAVSQSISTMSLAQAYELALTNDASLKAARAQVDVVSERVSQAQALRLPNVSASASHYLNDLNRTQTNQFLSPSSASERYHSHSVNLQVRQPLYRPAIAAGIGAALSQLADAQALLQREQQTVGFKAMDAYLQALLAQENQSLYAVQHRLATVQLDAARKRFESGTGIRTEIDEAKARVHAVQAQQLIASQTRQAALLTLQLLVQEPLDAVEPLNPAALESAHFNAHTADYWLARALQTSPDLHLWRARLQVARWEVKRAETGHLPMLDAVLQITRSASENVTSPQSRFTNRQVGLQLNVPLYAGGSLQSAVRQALAEVERIAQMLEAASRELHTRLHTEWRGVTEGTQRMAAMELAVASADEVVVSVGKSYQAGVRTVLDVLNAEQQAQQARRDLTEARLNYVAARLRLLSLAGELDLPSLQQLDHWFGRGSQLDASVVSEVGSRVTSGDQKLGVNAGGHLTTRQVDTELEGIHLKLESFLHIRIGSSGEKQLRDSSIVSTSSQEEQIMHPILKLEHQKPRNVMKPNSAVNRTAAGKLPV